MKAEEINSFASLLQVHDPRLVRLELKPKLGQDRRQRGKRAPGLPLGVAQRQQIIGVADQHPAPARPPFPIKPVQVDVAQDGRDHPALRSSAHALTDRPRLHHPSAQHCTQELQQATILGRRRS
jgi:hypothetical protein